MVSDGLQIVGIVVEVMAIGYLRRTAVPAPVVRDDPITFGEEEQHLRVAIVRRERPAVTKNDRLAAAPIFIVDLYSVFGCDVAHIFSFLLMVHCCLPRFNSEKSQVRHSTGGRLKMSSMVRLATVPSKGAHECQYPPDSHYGRLSLDDHLYLLLIRRSSAALTGEHGQPTSSRPLARALHQGNRPLGVL
jgi:hypothetical protein